MMVRLGLGFLLIFWAIYMILTIVLVYIIAVRNDHVYPFLPTISHAGSATPERNIFAELMVVGAFWSFVNLFTRFLQLKQNLDSHNMALSLKRVNVASLVFAVWAVLGLVTIASWPVPSYPQENPTMSWVHSIGSGVLYTSSAVYLWLQTVITYSLWRAKIDADGTLLFCVRLVLAIAYTASGLIHGIFDRAATRERQQFDKVRHSYGKWEPGEVGYSKRTISDFAEWMTVLGLIAYTVTFFKEFQSVQIDINCHPTEEANDVQYTKLNTNNTDN